MNYIERNTRRQRVLVLLPLLAMLSLVVSKEVSAGEVVVLEAQGTAHQPGAVLDEAQSLTLGPGQVLSLITANGKVVRLAGPYSGPAVIAKSGESNDVGNALKALLQPRIADKHSPGAMRDSKAAIDGKPAALPEAWLIDVAGSGDWCVREGEAPVVWRAAAAKGGALTITALDHPWRASADWAGGFDRIALPPAMPVAEGSRFRLGLDQASTEVTLHSIPKTARTDKMAAAWMLAKGCRPQALVLGRNF